MKKTIYWHKLDNAAKIFPATSKKARSNVFRLSFYLDEVIDPLVLEEAVNVSLKRFQAFAVQLKSGIFWNYLSENNKRFKIEREPAELCKFFKSSDNNGYLFKVYYLYNKVSLEMFHALTDGTGGLIFLKSIVYKYFEMRGFKLNSEGKILSELPYSNKENIDMFVENYDKHKKRNTKDTKAYHLSGDTFKNHWNLLYKLKINKAQLLHLVKTKYQTTLTQFMTALIAYAVYEEGVDVKNSIHPIKIVVPVNLRNYFATPTLRNFSLFVTAQYATKTPWTFDQMLESTKKNFKDQLVKDKLHERLSFNVGFEKNVFLRITPLFLKTIAFKIGYYLLGSSIHTISFSNLGNVDLPIDLENKILDADFITSGTGITGSILSFKDTINITFTSIFKDMSVLNTLTSFLVKEGLDIIIDTNYKEGYDEIL